MAASRIWFESGDFAIAALCLSPRVDGHETGAALATPPAVLSGSYPQGRKRPPMVALSGYEIRPSALPGDSY
jgi:hypothetical protein